MVADYVLKKAPPAEFEQVADSIAQALRVLPDVVNGNMDKAMHALHTTK